MPCFELNSVRKVKKHQSKVNLIRSDTFKLTMMQLTDIHHSFLYKTTYLFPTHNLQFILKRKTSIHTFKTTHYILFIIFYSSIKYDFNVILTCITWKTIRHNMYQSMWGVYIRMSRSESSRVKTSGILNYPLGFDIATVH